MKKLYTIALLMLISLTTFAQGRMIVQEKSGSYKGFLVERIDSVFFDTEDYGRVAADVTFKDYKSGETGDSIWLSVQRTNSCESFRIDVMQKNLVDMLGTDDRIAIQLEYQQSPQYWQDFEEACMYGFEFDFVPDADYTIVTVGYDAYGIACSASRADFHTPKLAVTGNPYVECNVDGVTPYEITLSFKPNEDTSQYAFCLFPKGELQTQFEMYGAMFGLANIGDMILQWGIKQQGDYTYTYKGQEPDTEYELFVQPLDVNGVNGEYTCTAVTTSKLGGEGVAEVTITIGEFGQDEYGTYQYITMTPNENVSVYRQVIIEKSAFLTDEYWAGSDENVVAYLKQDLDQYGWNCYKEETVQWGLKADTEYVIYAIAKNIKDEWGPLTKVEHKTPVIENTVMTAANKVPMRRDQNQDQVVFKKGVSPFSGMVKAVKPATKLQLVEK